MTAVTELPFVVKVCGITNEEDARVAVEAGANALGFNFYGASPRYIAPARARHIGDVVEGAYLKVGVFVNSGAEEILDICRQAQIDVVQLHGDARPLFLPEPYRLWRGIFAYGDLAAHEDLEARAEAYLIDSPSVNFGGSGQAFDWSLAKGLRFRFIVAGGLDGTNVGEAIRSARPWGVDACSRLECSPGKKDAQRVRDFVHAALEASPSVPQGSTL